MWARAACQAAGSTLSEMMAPPSCGLAKTRRIRMLTTRWRQSTSAIKLCDKPPLLSGWLGVAPCSSAETLMRSNSIGSRRSSRLIGSSDADGVGV